MTTPGNAEVASLLLKVGVDFEQLQGFVETLPVIPELMNEVGARIDAAQVGSAPIFAEKGRELTRAFVAGFQAEALGLNMGNIGDQITRSVFGNLSTARIDEYRQHVSELYATIRNEIPAVTLPLIDNTALRGLTAIESGAGGARSAVEGLQAQLGLLRAELATLQFASAGQLPKTVVRSTPQGALEYTPTARRVLDAVRGGYAGLFGDGLPAPAVVARDSGRGTNVAASNRATVELLQREMSRAIERLADQMIPNTAAVARAVQQPPAATEPGRAMVQALVPVERGADRAARALEKVARAAERIDTTTSKGELFSRGEVALQARQTRGQVDIFQAIAEAPPTGPSPEALAARRRNAAEYVLPPEMVARQRLIMAGSNESLRGYQSILTGNYAPPLNPMLPAGPGLRLGEAYAENERRRADEREARQIQRLQELANRTGLPITESNFRGSLGGLSLGPGEQASTLTGPRERVSTRMIAEFTRSMNEQILRALGAQVNADTNRGGFVGSLIEPDALRRTLGNRAYEDMAMGRGLGRSQAARLQPEALALLTGMSADAPLAADLPAKGDRLYPPGLLDTARARRELLDPNRLDPMALPWDAGRASQRAITAGSPFDPRLAPAVRRSGADELRARAAENARRQAFANISPRDILSELTDLLGGGRSSVMDELAQATGAGSPQERARRAAENERARVMGQIAGPGGTEANALARPIPADQLARFFTGAADFAKADPLLPQITENIRSQGIQQAATLEVAKDGLARLADGHHRTLAAQALGIPVPTVLRRSSLSTFEDGRPLPGGLPAAFQGVGPDTISPSPELLRALGGGPPPTIPGAIPGAGPLQASESAVARMARQLRASGADDSTVRQGLQGLGFKAAEINAAMAAPAGPVAPTPARQLALPPATDTPQVRQQRAGDTPFAQQRAAEVTYGANVRAAQRLDEALARLEQQLQSTARAAGAASAPLAVAGALVGAVRTGVGSLTAGQPTALPGVSSDLGRVGDAARGLPAADTRRVMPGGGPVPLGTSDDDLARMRAEADAARARARQAQAGAGGAGRVPPRGPEVFDPYGYGAGGGIPPGGGGRGPGGTGFPPGGPLGGPPPGGQPFVSPLSGFRQRVGAGLREGFLGSEEGDPVQFFSRSVASAARFSLVYASAYSALRLFTTAFSQGVQGAIQFETALTDLNLATERTGRSNERLAFQLADVGAGRGMAPGESVALAAQATGLYDLIDAPREYQEQVQKATVDNIGKLAFITGDDAGQLNTLVAGATRTFDIAPEDQDRVLDMSTFISRRTGRSQTEILQAVGQIGTLAETAGYDLPEILAMIARVTSRTGQSAMAVSGNLSQVLSRADDPRVQQELRSVGVTTAGTSLSEQLRELASKNLSDENLAAFNQSTLLFGRGRSTSSLRAILQDFTQVDALAEGARNDSTGLAQKDFEQQVNNIGGQLRTLASGLQDLFVGIASMGALDPLVALLSVMKQMVDAADFVVDAFNMIPRELRTAGFAVLEFLAIMALVSRFTGFGAAAVRSRIGDNVNTTRGGLFGRVFGEGEEKYRQPGSLPARTLAATSAFGSLLGTGVATGVGAIGAMATGGALGGPLAVGAGVTVLGVVGAAASLVTGIVMGINEADEVTRSLFEAGIKVNTATTEQEFDAALLAAKEARKAAEDRDDFKLLSKDILSLGLVNLFDDVRGGSQEQKELAGRQIQAAEDRRQALQEREQNDDFSVFNGFATPQIVAQGMAELAERGYTAEQRLAMLNQAFSALASRTGEAGASAVIFAGQIDTFRDAVATGVIASASEKVKADIAADTNPDNTFSGAFSNIVQSIPNLAFTGFRFATGALDGFRNPRLPEGPQREAAELRSQGRTISEVMAETGLSREQVLTAERGDVSLGRRISEGFRGGRLGAGEAIAEFIPFLNSEREKRELARKGAESIRNTVADPETLNKLNAGVQDVLDERGIDTSGGAVSLGPEDVEAIKERQLAILKAEMGDKFDKLPEEVREAYEKSIEESIGETIGGFNGERINAQNVRGFIQSTLADAGRLAADRTLTSGSALEGQRAAEDLLLDNRNLITQGIAGYDADIAVETDEAKREQMEAERDRLIQQLAQYDMEIAAQIQRRGAAQRADIQSLADLAKSSLLPGDVLGGIGVDLNSVRQQLATPYLDDLTKRQLQGQQNQLLAQQTEERRALTAQNAINAISPRNTFGRLQQSITNMRTQIAGMADGSQRAALEGQLADLLNQRLDYFLQIAEVTGRLQFDPRDEFNQLGAARATLLRNRQFIRDPLELERNNEALAQNRVAQREYVLSNQQAFNVAGQRNPNNALAGAQVAEDNALLEYREALVSGDSRRINQAVAAVNQTGYARLGSQIEGQSARRAFTSFTDGDSGIQQAEQSLFDARIALQTFDKGSAEYYRALRDIREAERGVASAYRAYTQTMRRLGTDLTDPVAQARADLQDVTDQINSARARGADRDTIAGLELQRRQAGNNLERTAFDTEMEKYRTKNQLGEISDQAYMDYLNSEKTRLEAIRERTFQQQQFLNEVNQALLGLNDQLQGQFNLGDIDVPSPFEARRLLATPTGGGMNTVSNVTVNINGGDLNEVRGVMAEYLGPVAISRTPTVTPARI